jgi:hypothetical protein
MTTIHTRQLQFTKMHILKTTPREERICKKKEDKIQITRQPGKRKGIRYAAVRRKHSWACLSLEI